MVDDAGTVGLAAGEQRAWVALLGVLIWLPPLVDTELRRAAGVSHVEYQVLWWLSVAEGQRLYMSTLADCSNVTASHLSRVAARLEKGSWIERAPDPADGRFTVARLTDEGARRVEACAPAYDSVLRHHVFAALDDEQVNQLERISRRLLASVRPGCTTPVPMPHTPAPPPTGD